MRYSGVTIGLCFAAMFAWAPGAQANTLDQQFTQNGGETPSGRPTGPTPDDDGAWRLMHINNHITPDTSKLGDNPSDCFAPNAALGEVLDSPVTNCNDTFDRLVSLKVLQLLWYFDVHGHDKHPDHESLPHIRHEFVGLGPTDWSDSGGPVHHHIRTPIIDPPFFPPVTPEPTSLGAMAVLGAAALARRPKRRPIATP